MDRIIPLGLTPSEATGWYIRNILKPIIFKGIVALAISSIAMLSTLTAIESYLGSTLTLHMIAQHFILATVGFLLAYGVDSLAFAASTAYSKGRVIYDSLLTANRRVNKFGIITFVVAAVMLMYWYLPTNFNMVSFSDRVHLEMHLTLFAAGGLLYVGSKALTKAMKRLAPVILSKAIGLSGAFLLLTPAHLYAAYLQSEQVDAGVAMVVMMVLLDLTIVPTWLYNYFGKKPPQNS